MQVITSRQCSLMLLAPLCLHKVSQHSCTDHIGQIRAFDVYPALKAMQCAMHPYWGALQNCSHTVCIYFPLRKRGSFAKVQPAEV